MHPSHRLVSRLGYQGLLDETETWVSCRRSHRCLPRGIHHTRCAEEKSRGLDHSYDYRILPFLIVVRLISKRLDKRMVESQAVLAYYAIAGSIGLAVEWLLIGLSPWSNTSANPVLMLVFQFGIFSFWGSVAFAPKLLMDRRASVAQLRKWYRRCLPLGFASIYFVTFTASQQARFILGVGSVLATFILLNPFYFQYFRILGRTVGTGGMSPGSRDSTAMNSSNMYEAPKKLA